MHPSSTSTTNNNSSEDGVVTIRLQELPSNHQYGQTPPQAAAAAAAATVEANAMKKNKELPEWVGGFNSSATLTHFLLQSIHTRTQQPIWKQIHLGLMAGVFISLGAILSLICAGGFSSTIGFHPIFPKVLSGITFPLGLFMIMNYGGDLFTGNCMFMSLALYHRKITVKDLIRNWTISWFSNFVGCVFCAYFGAYLCELYTADPWLSYLHSMAEKKVHLGFGVVFVRGIFANALVCFTIHLTQQSKDYSGRIIATYLGISAFIIIGYEHCVANMFLIPVGMMYGASVNTYQFLILNLLPCTLGNIVGGALVVGISSAYAFVPTASMNDVNSRPRVNVSDMSHPSPMDTTNPSSPSSSPLMHQTITTFSPSGSPSPSTSPFNFRNQQD